MAHFLQHFFSRDAPIHQPDALGLAVLGFDLAQKLSKRRFVQRVARQHFVSQRKALWRDDQRDHDLHAVTAFIAAVAKAPLVVVILGWITLEVSAGQIIEQHLEAGVKQVAPATHQMIEQRLFVLEQ